MSDAPALSRPVRPPLPLWTLEVTGSEPVTPHMKRVFFTGELEGFDYKPGQDLALMIPLPDGELGRRHYTLRSFDREARRLAIDFVLHGHGGPAEAWALAAKPGDRLDGRGPRGGTYVRPDADWHLFVGDETCLPGIAAMLETLPKGAKAFAFIEIENEADRQALPTQADVALTWLTRNGPAQPASQALIDAVAAFAFPPGVGQAYVIGETSTVRTQRQGLIARGFDKTRIAAEGYWRPGRLGGHDHINDPA
jgi:NADPH-dependent ferric siderophore reductase